VCKPVVGKPFTSQVESLNSGEACKMAKAVVGNAFIRAYSQMLEARELAQTGKVFISMLIFVVT